MSIRTPLDPRLVDGTRKRIRRLLEEIAQWSRKDVPPACFLNEFVQRLVTALGAWQGRVWLASDESWRQAASVQAIECPLPPEDEIKPPAKLLAEVLSSRRSRVISDEAPLPAASPLVPVLRILVPLSSADRAAGVVEIIQRTGASAPAQRGYVRFIEQACQWAGDFLERQALRELRRQQGLWEKLAAFTRAAQASLDLNLTAYTVANEGRRVLGCDRLSVVLKDSRHCKLAAISGQDSFDRRATTVRRLERLVSAVLATREPLWYEGDARNLPPQITSALQAYLDDAQARRIAVLPIVSPGDDDPCLPRACGALVVEDFNDSLETDGWRETAAAVGNAAAAPLAHALEHRRVFLLPLWKALGCWTALVAPRGLVRAFFLLAMLGGCVGALAFIPADFAVEGRGVLQPVERRDVYATDEGVVSQVLVRHGDIVRQGQPLAELRNVDLEVQLSGLRGQWSAALEDLGAVETSLLNDRTLTPAQRDQLQGRKRQLRQTLKSLEDQLALLEARRQRLRLTSPLAGQVTTLDLQQRLLQRPVERGQVLLGLANTDGPWELEIALREDRLGHVLQAQHAAAAGELAVTFILANDPAVVYQGRVREIHHRAEVRGDQGNTVLIKVDIDRQQIARLRTGAGVVARIDCGRRSLGYVWFHDVLEFFQTQVLFRL